MRRTLSCYRSVTTVRPQQISHQRLAFFRFTLRLDIFFAFAPAADFFLAFRFNRSRRFANPISRFHSSSMFACDRDDRRSLTVSLCELLFFGRAAKRSGRTFSATNESRDFIEVTRPNFTLMLGRSITVGLGRKFRFL